MYFTFFHLLSDFKGKSGSTFCLLTVVFCLLHRNSQIFQENFSCRVKKIDCTLLQKMKLIHPFNLAYMDTFSHFQNDCKTLLRIYFVIIMVVSAYIRRYNCSLTDSFTGTEEKLPQLNGRHM